MQVKLFLSLLIELQIARSLLKTVCTDVIFFDGSDSVRIFCIGKRTEFRFSAHPDCGIITCPPKHNFWTVMIVWRIRGKIICVILYTAVVPNHNMMLI